MNGVKFIPITGIIDYRGKINFLDFEDSVGFKPERIFYITNVPEDVTRGEHAHKKCAQFLIVMTGNLKLVLDNGREIKEVILDNNSQGVLIGPNIWVEINNFSRDCTLLVLASDKFDEADYIRNRSEFDNEFK